VRVALGVWARINVLKLASAAGGFRDLGAFGHHCWSFNYLEGLGGRRTGNKMRVFYSSPRILFGTFCFLIKMTIGIARQILVQLSSFASERFLSILTDIRTDGRMDGWMERL
jgi:hypothetical protein